MKIVLLVVFGLLLLGWGIVFFLLVRHVTALSTLRHTVRISLWVYGLISIVLIGVSLITFLSMHFPEFTVLPEEISREYF